MRNQVIGTIIQGLGGALFEAVDFENGRITNPHFANYRVPRFRDVPDIEAILIDRKDLPPAGAGETPIMGIAPAIGNAIFDATAVRLNNMPLVPNGLKLKPEDSWQSFKMTDEIKSLAPMAHPPLPWKGSIEIWKKEF